MGIPLPPKAHAVQKGQKSPPSAADLLKAAQAGQAGSNKAAEKRTNPAPRGRDRRSLGEGARILFMREGASACSRPFREGI